jgi:2-dehydropantoate 2-reductase
MTPADIFNHPRLFKLELAQLNETLSVMRAQGIRTVNLPATPVKLLEIGVRYIPPVLSRPLLVRAVGGGRGAKMPSFYIDLHSGRGQIEVDFLNGAVVRCGQEFGIPTPANKMLNETLLALSQGELPIDEFTRLPDKLADQLTDYS